MRLIDYFMMCSVAMIFAVLFDNTVEWAIRLLAIMLVSLVLWKLEEYQKKQEAK